MRKAIELARLHEVRSLLIEDKASGQQLIQALRAGDDRGVPRPISRKPEADKYTRAAGVSSMVEAGQVFIPEDAHWLAEFKSELLGFPNARYDDQVDALVQMLDWSRRSRLHETAEICWTPYLPFQIVYGDDYTGKKPENGYYRPFHV